MIAFAARRFGLLLVLLLAACATPPATPPGDIALVARAPLQLDVASIRLDEQYGSLGARAECASICTASRRSPVSPPPEPSRSRLVAAGAAGTATLSVLDGSVISEELEKKGGLTGLFGDQQDTKLAARLRATRLTVEGVQAGRASTEAGAPMSTSTPAAPFSKAPASTTATRPMRR